MPAIRSAGPARRDRLHRRPVRRRPAGDHAGPDAGRSRGHCPQLRARHRASQGEKGGSPRSWPATPRPARNSRVEARSVINATGVYVDAVRRLDEPAATALVSPSQGAHLVLDSSFFPGDTALLGPAHRRRPRALRDSLARSRAGRDDRHARGRGGERAAPASRRDRVSAELPRPVLETPARPRRRPEHVRRPAPAASRPGRRA